MKTDDMVKYAAMAAGAFLLYKWVSEQPSTAPATTPPAGGGSGSGGTKPPDATKPDATKPPPASPTRPSDAALYAAALSANDASQTGDWKMDGYTWNWYRMNAAAAAGWTQAAITAMAQADLGPSSGNQMTAAQYHELLKSIGVGTYTPPAAQPAPPAPPSTEDILNAAMLSSHVGLTGSWTADGHTWNWYRVEAMRRSGWTEEQIQAAQGDLGPTAGDQMTAAQYHELLKSKGLEGLGYSQSWSSGYRGYYQ